MKPFRLTHILTVHSVYSVHYSFYGIICVVVADIRFTQKRFSNAGGIYFITEQMAYYEPTVYPTSAIGNGFPLKLPIMAK